MARVALANVLAVLLGMWLATQIAVFAGHQWGLPEQQQAFFGIVVFSALSIAMLCAAALYSYFRWHRPHQRRGRELMRQEFEVDD